jgi:hypothetical protein
MDDREFTEEQRAARKLARLVRIYTGVVDRNEVECPREQSWMTPCVARDGSTAVADDGVCVACGERPSALVEELEARLR